MVIVAVGKGGRPQGPESRAGKGSESLFADPSGRFASLWPGGTNQVNWKSFLNIVMKPGNMFLLVSSFSYEFNTFIYKTFR